MENKERLMVASYNIRTNTQEDARTKKEHLWNNRFTYMKKMIEENDWDIIGFQEPSRKQLKDLATLTAYNFVGERRSDHPEAEYNPIFIKKISLLCWIIQQNGYQKHQRSPLKQNLGQLLYREL